MIGMPDSSAGKWVVLPCPDEGAVTGSAGQSAVLKTARVVCDFSQFSGLQHALASDASSTGVPRASQAKRDGDKAYKKGNFGNAINEYTQAIRKVNHEVVEGELMAKRSAAFAGLSTELRFRPASASALYGMDPYDLARLGLKDAQRLSEMFPKHSEGFLRQAFALFLLENYSEAEEACLEGLRRDTRRGALMDCLKLIQHTASDVQCAQWRARSHRSQPVSRSIDDFECILCLKLLCEPVTTPCGHSFCAQCLRRALDHNNKCPCCRTVLHLTQDLVVSVTLKHIIQKSYPEEYAARLQETAGSDISSSGHTTLPLFVLTTLMPGEKMALNIFEPRYRLMVRRVMSGSHRFGIVRGLDGGSGIENVACECEITECEPLPDGRYYLEVIGRRRILIKELWEQDGYRVGKVESMSDDEPLDKKPVSELSLEIRSSMTRFLSLLRSDMRVDGSQGAVQALLSRVSDEPTANDPETISFWAACLLPSGAPQRSRLLQTTSTGERLHWLHRHLNQLWEAKKDWDTCI